MRTVYCVNQYPIKALNFFEVSSDQKLSWTRLPLHQPPNLNFPLFLRSMPQPLVFKNFVYQNRKPPLLRKCCEED